MNEGLKYAGSVEPFERILSQDVPRDPVIQNVLANWSRIDGSATIKFLPRDQIRTAKVPEGNRAISVDTDEEAVYVADDLKLWEIPNLLTALGQVASKNNPGFYNQKAEEIRGLGRIFENAAIYIA